MPIPVTCAKCGYEIQAPDHVAGRTLRCFKCLTPFTVGPKPAAPMATFAPAPVAAFAPPPPAAVPEVPMPPPPPEVEEAPEFEINEEPLLLESEPTGASEAGGDDILPLEDMEDIEFLDDDDGKPPKK